mmetsp:Transcript_19348/g.31688  ORF Transcript_19348/g.31688 Transcript_19348/m.31688 type:complete len:119 (+) Transcript_19348:208-564(+)
MSALTNRLRRSLLTLTPSATHRLQELLAQKGGNALGIRLGVRSRGCNGLTYTLDYVDKKNKLDEEVSQNGVTVFVDPKAIMHVVGTKMDYVEDDMRSEFVFTNPNAKGSCGCGESFNV